MALYNPSTGIRISTGIDFSSTPFSRSALRDVMHKLTADKEQAELITESCTAEEADKYLNVGKDLIAEAVTAMYNRLDGKMKALTRVFGKYLPDNIKIMEYPSIGPDRKNGLFAYKTATFTFDDGQTVSILFHSPDNDPRRLQSDEMLIAYRWLLNKRDITATVSPENGRDLTLELMGRRMMQLVEANHDKFVAAQAKKDDQVKLLQDLESQQSALNADIDTVTQANASLSGDIELMDSRIAELQQQVAEMPEPEPEPEPAQTPELPSGLNAAQMVALLSSRQGRTVTDSFTEASKFTNITKKAFTEARKSLIESGQFMDSKGPTSEGLQMVKSYRPDLGQQWRKLETFADVDLSKPLTSTLPVIEPEQPQPTTAEPELVEGQRIDDSGVKTFKIVKKGRKYYDARIGAWKAKLEINSVVPDLQPDSEITLLVNDNSTRNRYGTNLQFEPVKIVDDALSEQIKKQHEAEKWLGFAEKDTDKGSYATSAIKKITDMEVPAYLEETKQNILSKAAENKAVFDRDREEKSKQGPLITRVSATTSKGNKVTFDLGEKIAETSELGNVPFTDIEPTNLKGVDGVLVKAGDVNFFVPNEDGGSMIASTKAKMDAIQPEIDDPQGSAGQEEESEPEPAPAPAPAERRVLFPVSTAPELNTPVNFGGKTITFTKRSGSKFIHEDSPSYEGSHLLGHEGERGVYLSYNPADVQEIVQPESSNEEPQDVPAEPEASSTPGDFSKLDPELYQEVKSSLDVISDIDEGKEKGSNRALFVSSIVNKLKTRFKNGKTDIVDAALKYIAGRNQPVAKDLIGVTNSVWSLTGKDSAYYSRISNPETRDGEIIANQVDESELSGMLPVVVTGIDGNTVTFTKDDAEYTSTVSAPEAYALGEMTMLQGPQAGKQLPQEESVDDVIADQDQIQASGEAVMNDIRNLMSVTDATEAMDTLERLLDEAEAAGIDIDNDPDVIAASDRITELLEQEQA